MDISVSNNANAIPLAFTSTKDTNNPINSTNNTPQGIEIKNTTEILLNGNDAAALLQMVTSKLSTAVIRKIPTNEYMQLLAILDRIIRVNDEV